MMHSKYNANLAGRLSRRGWRWPLWFEITVALALKLALLMTLKMIFFSHPLAEPEAAARLGAMIDGGAAQDAAPATTPHSTEAQ